jgi:hypothetical protein
MFGRYTFMCFRSVVRGLFFASRTQDRLQYFHLFLVAGVGSGHEAEGDNGGPDVPTINPAINLVEGNLAVRQNRQRPEEVGRVRDRVAKA